jgi:hypothetical protein
MKKQTLDERLELYNNDIGDRTKRVSSMLLWTTSAIAGAGAVLIPPPAEAAVVYSGIQNKQVSGTNYATVDFDGGGYEFTFIHMTTGGNHSQYVFAAAQLSFAGTGNLPNRLVDGDMVDSNSIVNTESSAIIATGGGKGNFLGTSGYLGVRFVIDTNSHYGWIQFKSTTDASVGTIIDWAYEDTPDTPIKAGDTGIKSFNWNLFLPAITSGNKNK